MTQRWRGAGRGDWGIAERVCVYLLTQGEARFVSRGVYIQILLVEDGGWCEGICIRPSWRPRLDDAEGALSAAREVVVAYRRRPELVIGE